MIHKFSFLEVCLRCWWETHFTRWLTTAIGSCGVNEEWLKCTVTKQHVVLLLLMCTRQHENHVLSCCYGSVLTWLWWWQTFTLRDNETCQPTWNCSGIFSLKWGFAFFFKSKLMWQICKKKPKTHRHYCGSDLALFRGKHLTALRCNHGVPKSCGFVGWCLYESDLLWHDWLNWDLASQLWQVLSHGVHTTG